MDTARSKPPGDWFESPLGTCVLREESALGRLALDDVFGFELLQVGAWAGGRAMLAGARTQHTTLVAPDPEPGVTLCAPLAALPFASDTIDAIVLPHTLELVEDPHAVLREAERVLCAEGCLIVSGFNPWSGWGARRLFAHYLRRPAFPPGTRRLLSEMRLRDWVALLGFDIECVYGYLGLLPIAASGGRGELQPPAPWRSGAYLLKARKRMQTLTQVRPKRRALQRVLVGVAEPTNKLGP
ncbi:MAG TPA: methyltransferase domain-containing protein [Steroidobacteraceae bacterium]|nr:methyltransferase domain-containing protein [Steroidobacteraceae bacterium]